MDDSMAWPLGKLVEKVSRKWGTIVGRGRLKACFIALFTISPLNHVVATNSAVRNRVCRSRKPMTASTTSARTVGPPRAVTSRSDSSIHAGPIGLDGSSGLLSA